MSPLRVATVTGAPIRQSARRPSLHAALTRATRRSPPRCRLATLPAA
jgi:hypothetical protein